MADDDINAWRKQILGQAQTQLDTRAIEKASRVEGQLEQHLADYRQAEAARQEDRRLQHEEIRSLSKRVEEGFQTIAMKLGDSERAETRRWITVGAWAIGALASVCVSLIVYIYLTDTAVGLPL